MSKKKKTRIVLFQISNIPTGNSLAARVEFGLLGLPDGPIMECPQEDGTSDFYQPFHTPHVIKDCFAVVPDNKVVRVGIHGVDCAKSLQVSRAMRGRSNANILPGCSRHGLVIPVSWADNPLFGDLK